MNADTQDFDDNEDGGFFAAFPSKEEPMIRLDSIEAVSSGLFWEDVTESFLALVDLDLWEVKVLSEAAGAEYAMAPRGKDICGQREA